MKNLVEKACIKLTSHSDPCRKCNSASLSARIVDETEGGQFLNSTGVARTRARVPNLLKLE